MAALCVVPVFSQITANAAPLQQQRQQQQQQQRETNQLAYSNSELQSPGLITALFRTDKDYNTMVTQQMPSCHQKVRVLFRTMPNTTAVMPELIAAGVGSQTPSKMSLLQWAWQLDTPLSELPAWLHYQEATTHITAATKMAMMAVANNRRRRTSMRDDGGDNDTADQYSPVIPSSVFGAHDADAFHLILDPRVRPQDKITSIAGSARIYSTKIYFSATATYVISHAVPSAYAMRYSKAFYFTLDIQMQVPNGHEFEDDSNADETDIKLAKPSNTAASDSAQNSTELTKKNTSLKQADLHHHAHAHDHDHDTAVEAPPPTIDMINKQTGSVHHQLFGSHLRQQQQQQELMKNDDDNKDIIVDTKKSTNEETVTNLLQQPIPLLNETSKQRGTSDDYSKNIQTDVTALPEIRHPFTGAVTLALCICVGGILFAALYAAKLFFRRRIVRGTPRYHFSYLAEYDKVL